MVNFDRLSISGKCCKVTEKVKVGNDQEKAQSESKSHPKNPRWEKTKLKLGYFENIQ